MSGRRIFDMGANAAKVERYGERVEFQVLDESGPFDGPDWDEITRRVSKALARKRGDPSPDPLLFQKNVTEQRERTIIPPVPSAQEALAQGCLRLQARREIEIEFKTDRQLIRVMVNGKPVPVRFLTIKRGVAESQSRVYDSAMDFTVEIELIDGEKFLIHTWDLGNGKPEIKPKDWMTQRRELWETQFQLTDHLEPEEKAEGWQPVRLYTFDDEE